MQWSLEKVIAKTYHLNFKNQTDLSEVFWRSQEYYESPTFKKKKFTLDEFREHYIENSDKDEFTYMTDWNGFNTPSKYIRDVRAHHNPEDFRDYDHFMFKIYDFISSMEGDEEFYLIGTYGRGTEQTGTYNHELCHALWASNQEYQKKAKKLLEKCSKKSLNGMFKSLKKMGYREEVFEDEANAYWSTGVYDYEMSLSNKQLIKFEQLFKKFRTGARKEIFNA